MLNEEVIVFQGVISSSVFIESCKQVKKMAISHKSVCCIIFSPCLCLSVCLGQLMKCHSNCVLSFVIGADSFKHKCHYRVKGLAVVSTVLQPGHWRVVAFLIALTCPRRASKAGYVGSLTTAYASE